MYSVFQGDDSWHSLDFNSNGNPVEDVIKIGLEFEKFPGQQVFIKDLVVYACIPPGMNCM